MINTIFNNNILSFGYRLIKTYLGQRIPLSVTVLCTDACNLKCIHCCSLETVHNISDDNYEEKIGTEDFKKMVDEFVEMGTKKFGFTGGEPLMREDIGELIDHCKHRNLITHLVTNGTLMEDKVDQLKSLDLLFISLEGDEKTHDKFRGDGCYEKVVEGIKIARENNISVTTLTTLTTLNHHTVEHILNLAKELGILCMFTDVWTDTAHRKDLSLPPTRLKEIASQLMEDGNVSNSRAYLKYLQDRKLPRCYAGKAYCIVDPVGKVYPCYPAYFDEKVEGYNGFEKGFREAFNSMKPYDCEGCQLACHAEFNYLLSFNLRSTLNFARVMRKR